jgi:phosphatidylserine/phosphatidylglycerophosphate/cardiolipin synthase-like enzyme
MAPYQKRTKSSKRTSVKPLFQWRMPPLEKVIKTWTIPAVGLIFGLGVMTGSHIFEPPPPPVIKSPQGFQAQACFTPYQACTTLLTDRLDIVKKSIYVQAYSFTSDLIAQALVRAKKRGVDVKVILDKSHNTDPHSRMSDFLKVKIPVRIDSKVAIAHNKVMILDGEEVVTGSFNFSNAAQNRNAENMIFLKNKDLAQNYISYFKLREKTSTLK